MLAGLLPETQWSKFRAASLVVDRFEADTSVVFNGRLFCQVRF